MNVCNSSNPAKVQMRLSGRPETLSELGEGDMTIIYDRKKEKLIDPEKGFVVGPYGFVDDGGISFGFHDPSSGAISDDGERWFRFSAYRIFDETDTETNPAKRKVVGFRVPALQHLLKRYHNGNGTKYLKAQQHIVAALSTYLRELDGIASPRIELA